MNEHPETHFVDEHVPGDGARVLLRNGRFVDVINGRYFGPEVSVVVQGDRIAAMPGVPGQDSDMRPDFAIDLGGRTVLPGLFNTHCHINMASTTMLPRLGDIKLNKKHRERQRAKNMAECLAHGITNIRDAYTEDLRCNWALREEISQGELPGPRIVQSVVVGPPGSYLAEKLGAVLRIMGSATLGITQIDHSKSEAGVVEFPIDATAGEVRDAVDRAIDERGAEAIKIGEQRENMANRKPNSTIMRIDQLEALSNQASRRGKKTLMHHTSVESFRRGVRAGVSSLSHLPFDAPLTKEDVEAFKAAGCIMEPTISVAYGITWKIKGDPLYDHPEMNRLTQYRDNVYTYAALADEYYLPELRNSLIWSYKNKASGKFKVLGLLNMSRMFRYYTQQVWHGFDNFRLLFEHGARMALSNDGGIPPCTPAMMAFELDFFDFVLGREPGMKRLSGAEAARIATINSACSMGLEKDFGSIEPGKIADLAIVDGDPFEGPHVLGSRVAALFMDGRLRINNCGLQIQHCEAD